MKFILGTAQLGLDYGFTNTSGKPELSKSLDIINCALNNNINIFDTAKAYGNSEYILGLANKKFNNLNIITKLDPLNNFDKIENENDKYKIIDNSINTSIINLNIDIIDTLLVHRFEHYNNKFIWNYLEKQQKINKINKLGVSIYTVDEAIVLLKDKNVKHIQLPINILDNQWFNAEFMNLIHKRDDVTIHARSILLQGILVSSVDKWPKIDNINPNDYINNLNTLVNKFNLNNRLELCFSYIKSINWINGLLIGVDNIEQLKDNIKIFNIRTLDDNEVKQVRNMFNNTPKNLLDTLFWSIKK